MSWQKAMAALLLLGGCAELGLPHLDRAEVEARLAPEVVSARTQRGIERNYSEAPFENGPLALLATEDGELRSWILAPCRGGAVCGGSPEGPAGRVLQTPDYVVVEGLYGRRFWLSWGGDGYVERQGSYVPLAWDARVNGTGRGSEPVLETPYRHH